MQTQPIRREPRLLDLTIVVDCGVRPHADPETAGMDGLAGAQQWTLVRHRVHFVYQSCMMHELRI